MRKSGRKGRLCQGLCADGGVHFSVIAALAVGQICASLIYSTAVQPEIISALENSLANAVDTESVVAGLEEAVAGLPALSKLLFDFGPAEETLANMAGFETAKIAAGLEEAVIRPVVEPLLETLIFAVSFLILISVVTIIAKGSKTVNKVPVIGKVNSFCGGLVGVLNGCVGLVIVSVLLRLFMSIKGEGEFISEAIISETYLFKWIYFAVFNNTFLV